MDAEENVREGNGVGAGVQLARRAVLPGGTASRKLGAAAAISGSRAER